MIQITECPRDAMQGIKELIPTSEKIEYLNLLLKVGFARLDAGSFVSPKAIPQMADTKEVFSKLELNGTTKLLAIIANLKGAEAAMEFEEISFLGFPFSVSETFQKRNTNSSIEESLARVMEIQDLCIKNGKDLLIYLSMAFGNPYGDPWNSEIVCEWASKMKDLGIKHLALADTTGMSDTKSIKELFGTLIPELQGITVSAHLHAKPEEVKDKTAAAWEAGCRYFDSALKGIGGCPMAGDSLTGNMDTERILEYCNENHIDTRLNSEWLVKASAYAGELFNQYH